MSGPVEDHVRRRDDGSREYVDSQGEVFPSVTTVISAASSKPWLTKWAAKLAAEFAVEQWSLVTETIAAAGTTAAVDLIKGAAARMRDESADKGTFVHDIVEALVTDGPIPIVPEELEPFVDAFLQFWMDFDPKPLLAEATVSTDPKSDRPRYAGRVDLLLEILLAAGDLERLGLRDPGAGTAAERVTVLVDVKTGANIDATMSAQLAAYRRADRVWMPLGEYAPLPKTDAAFVLHLRPEGYRLLPVDTDPRSYAAFLRMLELWHWKDTKEDGRFIGLPLLAPKPDGSQSDRPIDHVLDTSPKLCESLAAAGFPTCEAVAGATAAQLLAVKNVGPKTLEKIVAGIGEAGLKLQDGGA